MRSAGGLGLTWHPGRTPDTAQQLSVTFEPDGTGTRVRLVHVGWERLTEIAPADRDDYDSGWDYVLGRYVVAAA